MIYPSDIPGSLTYRPAVRALHAQCLAHIVRMVEAGATPQEVATYALSLGTLSMGVCMWIEDVSTDGSFADAVFQILAA